jgi:hypothetical protein
LGRLWPGLASAVLLRLSWYLSCQCSLSASSALTCMHGHALSCAATLSGLPAAWHPVIQELYGVIAGSTTPARLIRAAPPESSTALRGAVNPCALTLLSAAFSRSCSSCTSASARCLAASSLLLAACSRASAQHRLRFSRHETQAGSPQTQKGPA